MTIALDVDDEAAAAAVIQANVDAMTGPVTIATTVVRELIPLLDHPRLGPIDSAAHPVGGAIRGRRG